MKGITGFTLVELLIVIVVIAILAALGVAGYQTIRQRAYDAKVDATLEQVEKAFRSYAIKEGRVRLRHYSYNDFYATPGGGFSDHGVTAFSGGGIGREMANRGYLPRDLVASLKGGPTKDLSLKGGIKFVTCGNKKFFFAIESYKGISEGDFRDKLSSLHCDNKNYTDWAAEHGITLSAWGTASGTYRDQPNYKIAEIDILQ